MKAEIKKCCGCGKDFEVSIRKDFIKYCDKKCRARYYSRLKVARGLHKIYRYEYKFIPIETVMYMTAKTAKEIIEYCKGKLNFTRVIDDQWEIHEDIFKDFPKVMEV